MEPRGRGGEMRELLARGSRDASNRRLRSLPRHFYGIFARIAVSTRDSEYLRAASAILIYQATY